jgi:hypothetical protein
MTHVGASAEACRGHDPRGRFRGSVRATHVGASAEASGGVAVAGVRLVGAGTISRVAEYEVGGAPPERYERAMAALRWMPAGCAVCALVACADSETTQAAAGGTGPGGAGGAEPIGGAPADCPTYAEGEERGRIEAEGLVELSGLVASRAHPGVLWAHNDSGDEPRVFALRADDGAHLGTYAVLDALALDWEDLALGPHLGDDALFIGDIGDNAHLRATIRVFVLPEPAVTPEQALVEGEAPGATELTLSYPNGPENAEAMFVEPDSGDLYVLTKTETGASDVYRKAAPHAAGDTVLERVAALPSRPGDPHVTGADISPDGARILVRSYDHAFLYLRPAGGSVADALSRLPCDVPQVEEPQGEAIAFAADGSGYFTASEDSDQPLWFFAELP